MSKIRGWIWGVLLMAAGVIWGMKALGLLEIDLFFPGWWTMVIIVPCVFGLFRPGSDRIGDVAGILFGTGLLLAAQNVITYETLWKMTLPIALVFIGLTVILKDILRRKKQKRMAKMKKNRNHRRIIWAVFGEQDIDFTGEKFTGCEMGAVFGTAKCDLREAEIEDGAVLEVTAVFGAVEILVPKGIRVETTSTAVLGGVENRRGRGKGEATLFVDATCVLGGVEVK